MSVDVFVRDCAGLLELEMWWLCPVTLLDKAFLSSCSVGLVGSVCAAADLIAQAGIKKGPQPKLLLHAGKLWIGVVNESKESNKRGEIEFHLSGDL